MGGQANSIGPATWEEEQGQLAKTIKQQKMACEFRKMFPVLTMTLPPRNDSSNVANAQALPVDEPQCFIDIDCEVSVPVDIFKSLEKLGEKARNRHTHVVDRKRPAAIFRADQVLQNLEEETQVSYQQKQHEAPDQALIVSPLTRENLRMLEEQEAQRERASSELDQALYQQKRMAQKRMSMGVPSVSKHKGYQRGYFSATVNKACPLSPVTPTTSAESEQPNVVCAPSVSKHKGYRRGYFSATVNNWMTKSREGPL